MDFNKLYFDHQVSRMRADRSRSRSGEDRHGFHASVVAGRIGREQRALGAAAAPGWEALAFPTGCLAASWNAPKTAE